MTAQAEEKPLETPDKKISRRRLLKTLAAAGGAAAASTLLPGKWSRPKVEVGVLPAHAQGSPMLGTGDLQVTLTWDLGDSDVDLHLIEPDTTHVYFGNPAGYDEAAAEAFMEANARDVAGTIEAFLGQGR